MHRDPWFAWYRRVFFVSAVVYAVLTAYAALGQPLLEAVDSLTRRWFSSYSAFAHVLAGALALMLIGGGALVVSLVVRAAEWFDARERERSSV